MSQAVKESMKSMLLEAGPISACSVHSLCQMQSQCRAALNTNAKAMEAEAATKKAERAEKRALKKEAAKQDGVYGACVALL